MHDQTIAFTTPPDAPRWMRWMLFSPLARIAIHALGWLGKDAPATIHGLAQLLMRALPALLAYLLLVRLVERRPIIELAPRRLLPDGAVGAAAGLLLFSAVVGVLYLLGSYHVTGTNPDAPWVPALLMVSVRRTSATPAPHYGVRRRSRSRPACCSA